MVTSLVVALFDQWRHRSVCSCHVVVEVVSGVVFGVTCPCSVVWLDEPSSGWCHTLCTWRICSLEVEDGLQSHCTAAHSHIIIIKCITGLTPTHFCLWVPESGTALIRLSIMTSFWSSTTICRHPQCYILHIIILSSSSSSSEWLIMGIIFRGMIVWTLRVMPCDAMLDRSSTFTTTHQITYLVV